MQYSHDYDIIKWEDYFYLDSTSPSGLRRKVNIYSGMHKNIVVGFKDDIAGTKRYEPNGKPCRWRVKLNFKNYQVHRIIYTMLNGSIDRTMKVDHLDGNPFNNSVDNLVLKTNKANCQNQSMFSNNTSGVKGVSLSATGKQPYWVAHWRDGDKQVQKNFSIKKHGYEAAKQMAIDHRNLPKNNHVVH